MEIFRICPDDNDKPSNTDKPQCKTCSATIAIKTSKITNLHIHLQQKHPQFYAELMKTSLSTSKATNKMLKDLFET